MDDASLLARGDDPPKPPRHPALLARGDDPPKPPRHPALVRAMQARLPAILADIEELVRCESPSSALDAVAASAEVVAAVGARRLGTAPERIVLDGRSHLRWRFGGGEALPPGGTTPRIPRRVLVLAHHDTVWPLGSLDTHPFSVKDGVLRGPGCFDMKAGLVLALHALAELGQLPARMGPAGAGRTG